MYNRNIYIFISLYQDGARSFALENDVRVRHAHQLHQNYFLSVEYKQSRYRYCTKTSKAALSRYCMHAAPVLYVVCTAGLASRFPRAYVYAAIGSRLARAYNSHSEHVPSDNFLCTDTYLFVLFLHSRH